jgi:expansin (peptidoglycan-binding protein)
MNEVACQLPMVFNRNNGKLRVTAISKFQRMVKGLVCGDCIRVRNIHSEKSTVVMVIDFGGAKGLDLCPEAFNAIDTWDKLGHHRGHMNVEWEKTTCDDLIGNQKIKYRYKAGSGKNWYMGVTIVGHKVPLSRSHPVQISNNENDPNSWYECKANGANGYWFCSGHRKFDVNQPFYFRIESIDGQVLVDKINRVEEKNEGLFIRSVRRLQFKGCGSKNQTQTTGTFPSISRPTTRPVTQTTLRPTTRPVMQTTSPRTTTPRTTTTTQGPSPSALCKMHNCSNCLWDYKYGVACFSGWTAWHCRVQGGAGYHWCEKNKYSDILDKIFDKFFYTNCGIGNKYCI